MAHINLLPWRDWERERKKKEFLGNVAGVLVFGIGIILVAGWVLDGNIENQQARNNFLQTRIAELDQRISEIANLKKQRADLAARMRVIQELQGNRPVIVRVFDELVQTLASGVHYNKLEMATNNLKLEGTAESNSRISALMRRLDNSEWFDQPNLRSIKEDPENADYGSQASTFDLTFVQTNPNVATDEEGEG